MPIYEVEQYELHTVLYHVAADSEADAIVAVLAGEAEMVTGSQSYMEPAQDYGLPADDNPEIAQAVQQELQIDCDQVIPSIRMIRECPAREAGSR